jgi:guanylate kinase
MKQGKAIIFSAPSGSGKTTIVRYLLSTHEDLGFSISACTRQRRKQNEVDGKDYYFLTLEEFKQKIAEEAFVEWEQVYEGGYYGTLKSEITRIWGEGKHVLFDVDVKGGLSLKKYFKDQALAVFVKVPSVEELAKRLRYRNTETRESFDQRLAKAESEMAYEKEFDVTLINANLEDTLKKAELLIEAFIQN